MTSRTSVFQWPFIGVDEHDSIVYTLWTALGAAFIPVYVGETKRGVCRLSEHVGAKKDDSTEYTVRQAAVYLESIGHPTMFLVIQVPAKDTVKIQNELIAKFKRQDYLLLNGVKCYTAKDHVEDGAIKKIRAKVDELLSAAAEAGVKASAMPAPPTNGHGKMKMAASPRPPKWSTCHPNLQTFYKDGLCTKDHMLAVAAKKQQQGALAS